MDGEPSTENGNNEVFSILSNDPTTQIKGDDSAKEPRTLDAIDSVLIQNTPQTVAELESAEEDDEHDTSAQDKGRQPHDAMEENENVDVDELNENHDEGAANSNFAQSLSETENKEDIPENGDADVIKKTIFTQLPLSKIKRIMKMDPDTRLVSTDGVLMVACATELFVKTLATTAARNAVRGKRKTVQKRDIDNCILNMEQFEFLENMV